MIMFMTYIWSSQEALKKEMSMPGDYKKTLYGTMQGAPNTLQD